MNIEQSPSYIQFKKRMDEAYARIAIQERPPISLSKQIIITNHRERLYNLWMETIQEIKDL